MVKIIKEELLIEESLKRKIEFICDFCNTTPEFINGSIRKIDKTNLTYIEPHRIIINNITFLAFNLAEAEVNVLGSISNSKQLVESCEENLKKENILESEKELLQHTIEDTNYQIRTSKEIVKLIQTLKLRERNKNEKKY